jgi:hypothetical protein
MPRKILGTGCLSLCLMVGGCASEPLLVDSNATPPLALVPVKEAGIVDQRGRFREIFCALNADHGADLPDHRPCDQALHQLPGEPPAGDQPVNLGQARTGLHLMIVPGLAAQCFGEHALPLRYAARHVDQLGYDVSWIDVDGLSSSARNAAEISEAIAGIEDVHQPIVLLGYSKGMSDALEALADPKVSARVAAVVSVAGAVNGSPLADKASPALLSTLAYVPGLACGAGDRGALDSLRRSTRMEWLATHPLPPTIRYYSVVSFAAREQISGLLRSSYDELALMDPRNDSQLLFYDQILPASTLLGYVNADHWAIAMPIGRDSALAAEFIGHNAFPREILLEAILKSIEEDLLAAGNPPIPSTKPTVAVASTLPDSDVAGAQALLSPDETLEVLTFADPGSTITSGTVIGYQSTAYAVPVAAGQTLRVVFEPASANLYMNVVDTVDHSGAAVHRGETDGSVAIIRAPRDMTYLIRPFQPRAMARRNESGQYTLTVSRE